MTAMLGRVAGTPNHNPRTMPRNACVPFFHCHPLPSIALHCHPLPAAALRSC